MTNIKRQPYITYIVQFIFIGLIFYFYEEQLNNKQADTFDNFVFRVFATVLIFVSLILSIWTVIKRKKFKLWFGTFIFFVLTIVAFRTCYDRIYLLPYSQRFLLQNNTGLTLTNVKLLSDRTIDVNEIKPNETVKATYEFYTENTSISLSLESLGYKDTVKLVTGLTNSTGYLFDVKIKFKNNRYEVDVSN